MKSEIIEAIDNERGYQTAKWGEHEQQSLPGFITIMRAEIEEAERAWIKNKIEGRQTPLEEILQVVSVGVACLEKYGISGSAVPTDDLSLKKT